MMKLKPIDHDIHLKYLCPKCGSVTWLSFKEASTINYKVVCFCGNVFKVSRVEKIKIKYHKPKVKTTKVSNIPEDLLRKCTSIFTNYGFTKEESIKHLTENYIRNPVDDHLELVKQTLASMRTSNE